MNVTKWLENKFLTILSFLVFIGKMTSNFLSLKYRLLRKQ